MAHLNLAIVWYLLSSHQDVPESLRQAHLEAAKAGVTTPRKAPRFLPGASGKLDQVRVDYLNELARTRWAWGSCHIAAPFFLVGNALPPASDIADAVAWLQASNGLPISQLGILAETPPTPCSVSPQLSQWYMQGTLVQGQLFVCAAHQHGIAAAAPPGPGRYMSVPRHTG